jgi:putative flippase GtrA
MSRFFTGGRYALVAGCCLVTHNLVMILGDHAGAPMPPLLLISFGVVVLLGFTLHSRFTFETQSDGRSLLRYTGAMAANLPVTFVLLWLFLNLFGWPMVIASPATTALMLILNFFASQWAITAGRQKG